jgi:hypothetical protein
MSYIHTTWVANCRTSYQDSDFLVLWHAIKNIKIYTKNWRNKSDIETFSCTKTYYVRFEVFTAVRMMILVLAPCWLVGRDANVSEKHTVSIVGPQDGDSMFLRNTDIYLRVYTAPKPRRAARKVYETDIYKTLAILVLIRKWRLDN